jgi:phospholipid transport system substrate-binding protein
MKQLLKTFAGLLCLIGVAQAGQIVPAGTVSPDVIIQQTVQEVITVIQQDQEIENGDQAKILALVEAKILPRFDFVRMTRLAVGKYWRRATPAQRQALVAEFRNMLVRTYAKAFEIYNDQVVEVAPLRAAVGATDVTVKTSVKKPDGQSISVDYEMKFKKDDWKVYDVSIEGVSMVISYRGTFTSEIQKGGIDGLIETLSKRNARANDASKEKSAT